LLLFYGFEVDLPVSIKAVNQLLVRANAIISQLETLVKDKAESSVELSSILEILRKAYNALLILRNQYTLNAQRDKEFYKQVVDSALYFTLAIRAISPSAFTEP